MSLKYIKTERGTLKKKFSDFIYRSKEDYLRGVVYHF